MDKSLVSFLLDHGVHTTVSDGIMLISDKCMPGGRRLEVL